VTGWRCVSSAGTVRCTYAEGIAAAGLLIERLREPALPPLGVTGEHSPRWRRIPLFLHVRAVKPAG
jgi:hypothetical protein